jgi:hypothetical protein
MAFAKGIVAAHRGIRVDKKIAKAKGAKSTHKKLSSPSLDGRLEEFECRPFGPQPCESFTLKILFPITRFELPLN